MDALASVGALFGFSDPLLQQLVGISIVAALLYFALNVLRGRSGLIGRKGDAVLFLGDVGSGKTAALLWLRQGVFRATHTSMKENDFTFVPPALGGGRSVHVVDLPGHGSLRYRLGSLLPEARAVVFFVDAAAKDLSAAGEYLYSVLTSGSLVSSRCPITILAARSDAPGARSPEKAEQELLAVLESKRRVIHSMADLDAKAEKQLTLGRPDEAFSFDQHPCKVTLGGLSVKNGEVDDLLGALQL